MALGGHCFAAGLKAMSNEGADYTIRLMPVMRTAHYCCDYVEGV